MMFWLAIALGGSAGAICRFALGSWVNRRIGRFLPWGTLSVNVVGSGLVGVFAAGILARASDSIVIFSDSPWWAALGIGFCGSLTTISSWSLENLRLALDGRRMAMAGYIGLTLVLCLASVSLGYLLGVQLAAA